MSKVAMCDICTDVIEHGSGVVDGAGRLTVDIDNRLYNVIITFVEQSTGDRLNIDLCPKCLKKGGIGLKEDK